MGIMKFISAIFSILFFVITAPIFPEGGMKMEFSVPAFSNGGVIPDRFTCDGLNISPELKWSPAPSGTKSFVLIVHDPDAPRKGGWTHWLVWNIPATATGLPEHVKTQATLPDGIHQGLNDSRKVGYSGPCPPSGTHRYYFYLYALDETLDLPGSVTKASLEQSMAGHILAKGEWMGKFSR